MNKYEKEGVKEIENHLQRLARNNKCMHKNKIPTPSLLSALLTLS